MMSANWVSVKIMVPSECRPTGFLPTARPPLVCPVYGNERVVLLLTTQNDSSFNNLNRFEKILYLCNNYPRQLAKFVCRAYEHRQSLGLVSYFKY